MENAIHNGGEHNESKAKRVYHIGISSNIVLYAKYDSCNDE